MPEYLAPGVYVEETSFRSRSIEGVSTTTTGFMGAARYGPIEGEPELITSFSQFERIYGGLDPLNFEGGTPSEMNGYLAHAVRAFFDNGGARLYVSRAFTSNGSDDGRAVAAIPSPVVAINDADILAREATNTGLAALGEAITAAQEARAAVITVLRYGANQVLAESGGTSTTTITYDYGSGDDVEAQLTAFIAGISDTTLQAEAQTAFDNLQTDPGNAATNIITVADGIYAAVQTFLTNVTTTQTAISGAYVRGQTAGSEDTVPILAPTILDNPGNGSTNAITSLNAPLNNVTTAVDALAALSTSLETILSPLNNVTEASAINVAAQQVLNAAGTVDVNVNTTVNLIEDAATQSTLGSRATLVTADATFQARFPGVAGNMAVVVTGRLASNVLSGGPVVSQIRDGDLVVIQRGVTAEIYSAARRNGSWGFIQANGSEINLASLTPPANPSDPSSTGDRLYPLTLTVEVLMPGRFAQPMIWDGLTISAAAARSRDSVTQIFATDISNRLQQLETPLELIVTHTSLTSAKDEFLILILNRKN